MSVLSRIQELNKTIADAQAEIATLQLLCSHPPEAVSVNSSQSNDDWDSVPRYSRSYHCGICGRHWSEEDAS